MSRYKENTAGFTLVEIIISSFIMLMVVGIAMACFLSLLKQRQLIQAGTDVSMDLQKATRQIYNVVVASPASPIVFTDTTATTLATVNNNTYSGLCIRIAPAKNHYIMVWGGTDVLDAATNTLGYNKTRTTVNFGPLNADSNPIDPQATTRQLLIPTATCPSAAITSFNTAVFTTSAPSIVLSNYFSHNSIALLPQTGYGGPTQLTVNTVGTSSVTFTTALSALAGWGLPNGTLIADTSAQQARITIITAAAGGLLPGDLVYYPDDTSAATMAANYTVLAHNIVYAQNSSRIDPANAASLTDQYPFTYNTQTQELVVNLQCLPAGNRIAGRATIGTRMRILIRTPPDQRNI